MAFTVLVVDDDATIRQFIEMALTDQGYQVLTAEHGQAALDVVPRSRPGLILLDMRMPVMDGWGFAEAYRRTPAPHAPIIVLTAARDADESAREIGADACLAKPFDLRDLLGLIQRYASTPA
jgi:two-component system, chemotaxis family, chemotaxis protein CheY